MIEIHLIQEQLAEHHIDGWLIYGYKDLNELGLQFLHMPPHVHLTRRFFYWIPVKGEPVKLVHRIEPNILNHLPGDKLIYLSWQQLQEKLTSVLEHAGSIAMEYSPFCHIPSLSRVDGGTVELVEECGVEVISSAPIMQNFTSIIDDAGYRAHKEAMQFLEKTMEKIWKTIREGITELDVQASILDEMEKNGFETEGKPIVAFNAHAADPHFSSSDAKLKKGDLILIDLWAKKSIFADITQVGILGTPTLRQQELFDIVKEARDTAFQFVQTRLEKKEIVKGFEVDEVCRDVIKKHGYAEFFVHRTGHNIGQDLHGEGAHLDSLETLDERSLVKRTLFSIEPGIYIPEEVGVRLEYNVYINEAGEAEITGNEQTKLICL